MSNLNGTPDVITLRRRFAALIVFMQARFSSTGYLGLHLTLGGLILIGTAWVFGSIAEDVVNGEPLTMIDVQVSNWLHARTSPALTNTMLVITSIHSTIGIAIIASLIAFYLLWNRRWLPLLLLTIAVPGGILLNMILKYAFHRTRPVFDNPILTLTTYSFPSGHTMTATVFYGVLIVFAMRTFRDWHWRIVSNSVACFLILLVGFSRIYLGAHYLSDVLAAMVEGIAWLALCITAVDTMRRREIKDETARVDSTKGKR